jgi:hypothetical protein
MTNSILHNSRALWNRSYLRLDSDETLLQLLDHGEVEAWRALYRLAGTDAALRSRLVRLLHERPVMFPNFWKAALMSLGENVEFDQVPTIEFVANGGA